MHLVKFFTVEIFQTRAVELSLVRQFPKLMDKSLKLKSNNDYTTNKVIARSIFDLHFNGQLYELSFLLLIKKIVLD